MSAEFKNLRDRIREREDNAQEDDVSMLTMLGRAASGGAAIYIALLVAGCLFALLSILSILFD